MKTYLLFLLSFFCSTVFAQAKNDSIYFIIKKYNSHPKNYSESVIVFKLNNRSSDTILFYKNEDLYFVTKRIDKKSSVQKYFPDKADIHVITTDQKLEPIKIAPGKFIEFTTSQHSEYGVGKGKYKEKFLIDFGKRNTLKTILETEWVTINYDYESTK